MGLASPPLFLGFLGFLSLGVPVFSTLVQAKKHVTHVRMTRFRVQMVHPGPELAAEEQRMIPENIEQLPTRFGKA